MIIARPGLKVKVTGQGQMQMSTAYGRGNAVTRSVWLRSSTEKSFFYSSYIGEFRILERGPWLFISK